MEAEAAVADEADLAVEAFQAAVGEPEPDRGEDPVAVRAQGAGEADERFEPRAAGPGEPGVQVSGRQCRVGQVVEQPQLLAQQERAVEPPVVVLDFPEGGELADGLAFGRLEQRPAGALDPAAGRGVRALVEVPFVAADLIGGARSEPADVEGVEADLGARTAWRMACWYSPLMSIETARIESRRSPSSSKNACRVALLRPARHHTIAPDRWSATEVR